MFLKSYIYRDSCYSCKYACKNRCGDITIGDYWGIEKAHSEVLKENEYRLDYKNGISCLIVNTEQGAKVLEKYKQCSLDFKPNCSYELLNKRLIHLKEYLGTLKEEANILGIDLAVINDESN